MARRTKREIMDGVDCTKSCVIANNTVEYERENGERVIRLHLTDIVTFRPDGKIVLNSGGWKTPTTKARMNDQLGGTRWNLWQEKNEWYISRGYYRDEKYKMYHYHDGIVLGVDSCDGVVFDKSIVKKRNAHRRKLKKYAKDFITAMQNDEVPAPSGGDCWFCSFVDTKGQSWGEMGSQQDHIYHHIHEKYYVPSLLMRAIKMYPVAPVAEWCLGAVWGEQTEESAKYRISSMCGFGWEQLEKSIYRYVLHYAPDPNEMERVIKEHEGEAS